jgi:DNA polymerase III subunit delta
VTAACTLPFLSDSRLVIVKDANKIKLADAEIIAAFLKNPPEGCCLVLLWRGSAKKEKAAGLLFEAVNGGGSIVEFKPLYENQLPFWIKNYAKKFGKTLSAEAARYLTAESGSNLYDLGNEIEKLSLYCGKKTEISLEDVEKLTGHTKKQNLFKLRDFIQAKDRAAAFEILEGLLREREEPLKILSSIYYAIRRLLEAKILIEKEGCTEAEAAGQLRLNSYFDKDFLRNLRGFRYEELARGLEQVLNADLQLKSSSKPGEAVLEELLVSLV